MNELIEKFKGLLESQEQLAKQAVLEYQPIVANYIAQNCTDSNQIAYTLDFMLDFCSNEQMLTLYRKLCRHLYSFDPETAHYCIEAYRERWDEEGVQFGNNKKKEL